MRASLHYPRSTCSANRSPGAPVFRQQRLSWHTAPTFTNFVRPKFDYGLSSEQELVVASDVVCQAMTKAERLARRAEINAAKEPEAQAVLRYCRGSANKMRRVIDTIRGRTYEEALLILEILPYRATEPILKTLLSAAANAKHNLGMKKTRLYVSECYVDEAPVFKRFRCRAKGRPAQILKRNSHITIKVKEKDAQTEDAPAIEATEVEVVEPETEEKET